MFVYFMYSNWRSSGHVFRCIQPHSAASSRIQPHSAAFSCIQLYSPPRYPRGALNTLHTTAPRLAYAQRRRPPLARRAVAARAAREFASLGAHRLYASACTAKLWERASEQTKPKFDKIVEGISTDTEGKAILAPVKSEKRAEAKASFKYVDGENIAWHRPTFQS